MGSKCSTCHHKKHTLDAPPSLKKDQTTLKEPHKDKESDEKNLGLKTENETENNKKISRSIQQESLKIDTKKADHSPFIPNEKSFEVKINRSMSAVKLGKEDVTPKINGKRNVVSLFIKSKTKSYFQNSEKDVCLIHSKQRKKDLKLRNSQFLNSLLIDKFQLKVNFERIPQKEGDTSVEHPASQNLFTDKIAVESGLKEISITLKEEINRQESQTMNNPTQFYFKTPFLNELLENIYTLNTAPLKKYELLYEEKTHENKLKIYWTNYTTTEKNKVNIFRTEFFAPCHPEYFLEFMNNIDEQTKMDLLLDKYYIAEGYTEKTNVIYLSYKKTIVSSARDFVYVKHWGKLEKEGETVYCDTSRSIEHTNYPVNKNSVRGDIIYSGHVVKLIKDEKGMDRSFCRMYSECDFKINVPAFLSKKFSKDEMKAYNERCLARIKELLNKK